MKMKKLEEILPQSQPSPQTNPRLAQLGHQGLPQPNLPPFAEKVMLGELLTSGRGKEFSKKANIRFRTFMEGFPSCLELQAWTLDLDFLLRWRSPT